MTYLSPISRSRPLGLAAAVVGMAVLTAGPVSAESMLGDQSFERGPRAAAVAQPATPAARATTDWSAASAAGVEVDVVAEYAADVPGVGKVQLRKMTLAPGAALANLPIADQIYCIAMEGEVSVTDHAKGTTATYRPGDHWVATKGTYTLSNPGASEHTHYFYAMVMPPVEPWRPAGLPRPNYMGKL